LEELERAWANLQGERWNTENAVALACVVKPVLPKLLALARSASEAKARLEELTGAMAHIRASGHCGADIMEPEKVLAWNTSKPLLPTPDIVTEKLSDPERLSAENAVLRSQIRDLELELSQEKAEVARLVRELGARHRDK
jgi:hypothetical protein